MIIYERQKDGTLKQVDSPPKRAELIEQRIYDRCIVRVEQLEAEKVTLEARIDELCAENERLRSVVSDGADNAREMRAENAKLRKVCKRMHDLIKDSCDVYDEYYCSSWDEDNECCVFDSYMRELGVDE